MKTEQEIQIKIAELLIETVVEPDVMVRMMCEAGVSTLRWVLKGE